MVTNEVLAARVALGAETLDKALGPKWDEKIDLESLAMWQCHKCVLGQLFDHFIIGLDALRTLGGAFAKEDFYTKYSRDFGFVLNEADLAGEPMVVNLGQAESSGGWKNLRLEWVQLIENRRRDRIHALMEGTPATTGVLSSPIFSGKGGW